MKYLWIVILISMFMWVWWQGREVFLRRPSPRGAARHYPARPFSEIAQDIAPSVVAITAAVDDGADADDHRRMGSGLIIDPGGLILTNRHLVEGAVELEVTLWDGRRYSAQYYRPDEDLDIALVKIDAADLHAADLGTSSGLRVGQWALACGNPFSPLVASSRPAVSVGIISGLNRDLAMKEGIVHHNLIQTDAAINFGNSGGPLLDLSGKVVGITSAIVSSSGANEGMGFAIPIDDIIPRLERLRSRQARLMI